MIVPSWFWFAVVSLVAWGLAGILQKLATNYVSAESSLVWLVFGFLLLQPLVYPGRTLHDYSTTNLVWALLSGLLNALGTWALFAALKSGGHASVVSPITALYPLAFILFIPLVLHESITHLQFAGIVCSLVAIVLLSA